MKVQFNTYKSQIKTTPCKNNIYNIKKLKKSQSQNFTGNPFKIIRDFQKYQRAKLVIEVVKEHLQKEGADLPFRHVSMEEIEGLQFGIKAFKGLSMKDIQYMSENLHVIAVKRGCNNMCGYCYANAKPSKREMSWEDFTTITKGFKEIKKRTLGLPIFGENISTNEKTYKVTELYYDADCMDLAIKDKKGKLYDFIDLTNELTSSLGRKSVFDTSGWMPENTKMQERAEKYAKYFSKDENIEKLEQFAISFNVFHPTYIASVKAQEAGDIEKAQRLRNKYTDRIANAIYTFTQLLDKKEFCVMQRCFGVDAINAEKFNLAAMYGLSLDVIGKVKNLYAEDLHGTQKYIKSVEDYEKYSKFLSEKLSSFDTGLNSVGRMKDFMKAFNIKADMQDHTETTKLMIEDLRKHGRHHKYLTTRLIDTDGKVYHMDYARFIPTDIQLNIKDKTPTPKLANLNSEFTITKDLINSPEYRYSLDNFK